MLIHWAPWLGVALASSALCYVAIRRAGTGWVRNAAIIAAITAAMVAIGSGVAAAYLYQWRAQSEQEAPAEQIAPGIRYLRENLASPRANVAHIAFVDLTRSNLSFVVTHPDEETKPQLRAKTVKEFLLQTRSTLAVNANFFQPFSSKSPLDYYPKVGDPVWVLGAAAAEGYVYGTQRVGNAAIHISRSNTVTLGMLPENVWNAVGGDQWLLRDGQSVGPTGVHATNLHPRTAVGLSRDTKTFLLVIVDGRQPKFSEGMTLPELGQLMQRHGAYNAINLDGGGSATMVMRDSDGNARTLNSPIHTRIPGRQRPIANHLGVRIE